MSNTTKDNILAIAPGLSSLADASFDLVLADVADQVKSSVFGKKTEIAQRYLAAHLLTEIQQHSQGGGKSGPITSEKTGDIAVSYAQINIKDANRYDTTFYGREFNRFCKRCIVAFKVITP